MFCNVSDPNYTQKTLLNTEYSGFITRDFYQVIVDVPIPGTDTSILQDRSNCMQKSRMERDKIVVNQLRKISMETEMNKRENPYTIPADSFDFYLGDYSWFLSRMFLFQEDYSDPKKCKFTYRIIEKDLFSKVENTRLSIPVPKKKDSGKKDPDAPAKQTEQTPQNSTQPLVPGISK